MGEIYNQRKAVISGTKLDDMEVDSSEDSKLNEAFTKATKAIGKIIVTLTGYFTYLLGMYY